MRDREVQVVGQTTEVRARRAACGGQATAAKWRQIREDERRTPTLAVSSDEVMEISSDDDRGPELSSVELLSEESGEADGNDDVPGGDFSFDTMPVSLAR